MKKGFTLVELLIVMVIVGTLVTVALPKYQAAMERGRAQEAFANLKAASDIVNAQYVLNGNDYGDLSAVIDSNNNFLDDVRENFTKVRLFTAPKVESIADGVVRIFTTRENEYTLVAVNDKGELKRFECLQADLTENYCFNVGMDQDENGLYLMDLTDF